MRERSWQQVLPSRQTQFRYDGLNRVTEIADARQGITRFDYDQNGNLLTVKDAKLQATSYVYDSMDRLKTRTDALTRLEQYVYDLAGNLAQFTDRKNQQSIFTYDNLNRRTRADYADGSFATFVYDAVGRLTRATDSTSGAIDFFYDNLDRLILEVTPQGAVAYEYDAIGRRTKMTVAAQAPVTYQYDAASRLTQVAQGNLVVGLGYDAAGRRTSLAYPNGTNTTYTYDNASRLTTITHNGSAGLIENLSYTYDAAGNRISLTRTNATATNLPVAVQAAYDAANEQVTFNSLPSTFDANGNLITSTDSSGTTTYTWDARNRLIAQAGPGVSATFQYDVLGRRVSATINGQTRQMLYDGNDIVAEIGSGAVSASYLHSLNIDERFVRQTSAGNEFYHTDALGSALDLTNQAGAVQASYQYEAFGKTTMIGVSSNPFQYTGRENDGTGLYYYRARYYGSSAQVFISPDPIKLPIPPIPIELQIATLCTRNISAIGPSLLAAFFQEPKRIHPYMYVLDNPLRTGDPLGFGPSSECGFYFLSCAIQGTFSYPCAAVLVCYAAPDNNYFNCVRNCLLDEYKKGCTSWDCQFTGGKTGGGAHGDCFKACAKKQ